MTALDAETRHILREAIEDAVRLGIGMAAQLVDEAVARDPAVGLSVVLCGLRELSADYRMSGAGE